MHGGEHMSAELGFPKGESPRANTEVASVRLDLGLLWYLHEVSAGHLIADCEHAQCALGTTLLLEEGIVCCEDTGAGEAAVQFSVPELVFLLGLVRRGDKDG